MRLIGLTGGIAAGKSTIGRRLAHHGAHRIDADALAREAVAPGSPGLARVAERFGAGVVHEDGSLDRAALGAVVFGDPAALGDLNAIVHPEVRRLFREQVDRAVAADPDAIIVYEVPLLVETSAREEPWDLVVVAEADAETRIGRMTALRGMTAEAARQRIDRQGSDAERRAIADIVIDTSGAEEETLAHADRLWERLISLD
ncbi:dephospho-CoA kinase [Leucobacter chromiiresistens]|uniref:Dephospho-CoA kinase n=1 Tax=Leucobacter chromiiresistens TaxID=1079994 RepID=A0A147EQ29_9MICO|nr:dephospho-CoA kinase [Leucobacter chromiiresistens]KTR86587.1 dephospho-CoA kinase [Leucobacter chromiiresistens]